nr:juvenile hormone esterase-like [Onthophagus taurus]
MFWIHGGGFTMGSSNVYKPDFFMTKDIVLVTINYRLGVMGFLSFEDPKLRVPGNAGFKDQVMALKWVQRNITKFGGNPNNVTIFGESAGGCSTHNLILSPMAKGLFHKAIAQSGCALNPWSIANNPLKKLLKSLNYNYNNDKDTLKYLQSLPIETIFEAQDLIGDNLDIDGQRDFGLILEKPSKIEENFLTEEPIKIIKRGDYNKVPIIFGYTDAEGLICTVFNLMYPQVKLSLNDFEEAIPRDIKTRFGNEILKKISEKIKGFYSDRYILLHGDIYFVYGIQKSAEEHLKTSNEPIYLYRFSVDGNRNLFKAISKPDYPGASHADDLAYLFHMDSPQLLNNNIISINSLEDKTIKRMIELWTNFATTGNPNPTKPNDLINVTWKPISNGALNFIDIGSDLSGGINPDGNRMDFWKEIYNSVS